MTSTYTIEAIKDDKLDTANLIKTLEALILKHGYNQSSVDRYMKYYNIAGQYCKEHGYISDDGIDPCDIPF